MSTRKEIKSLIVYKAEQHQLDPKLLLALAYTESSYRPFVTTYETDYRWLYKLEEMAKEMGVTVVTEKVHQQTSWGLCQVMGAVAREYGFRLHMPELCDPLTNLEYACIHLKKKIKQYSLKDPIDIYACYNAGRVEKKNGEYVNKKNVDRFKLNLSKVTLP